MVKSRTINGIIFLCRFSASQSRGIRAGERIGLTIDSGWFSPLPRLEAILLAVTRVLRSSMPPATRTPPKRDDYPRSTLAREVEGYDPEGDPIAAYLASCPQ
jgi:hypothetical protein